MRLLHTAAKTHATFDDPNLVSHAGLIAVAARPARIGRDQITWHLPETWPWQHAWLGAFDTIHRPPPALAA